MRRLGFGLVLLAVATMALTGCATMRAGSHVERGLDFTRYRTFDWGVPDPLPAGDPRLDHDRYFEDRVEGAIEKQMAAHGYVRVALDATPDVRIHYHAVIDRRFDINDGDRRSGYCETASCDADVVSYEEGTLVVDLIDVRTNRLIWRGWAQDSVEGVLGNRDRLARRVDESVTALFQQFPATP